MRKNITSRHISPFFGFTSQITYVSHDATERGARTMPVAVLTLGSYFSKSCGPTILASADMLQALLNSRYVMPEGSPEHDATRRQLTRALDAIEERKSSYPQFKKR